MKIIAVDDEMPSLNVLRRAIKEVNPKHDVYTFQDPQEAVNFFSSNLDISVAFSDIRMWGINGIDFAKQLKKINPHVNIIFQTGYPEYMGEAISIHASEYLLKPIDAEKVRRALNNLVNPVEELHHLEAKTFGNFDFLVDGHSVRFKRTKAKEALAYLVDKNGTPVSKKELFKAIFSDEEYSLGKQNYLAKIMKEMFESLKEVGALEVVTKGYNSYKVNPDKFYCDAYEYLKGVPSKINAFRGEYMSEYSWSEYAVNKFYYNVN